MAISESSDTDLLAAWVRQRDEAAFHALVSRYTHLVHMAARRTCGDDALAADASQLVFMLLARKAGTLLNHTSLAGWLHLSSVRTVRDLIDKNQREARKLERFQQTMETHPDPPDDPWRDLQPALDEALAELPAKDREALLLRFYRTLSVKEVAGVLGIAAAAAQKRIDRATERLRGKLVRRGCRAGGTLAGVLLAGFAADAQAAVPATSVLAGKAIASGTAGGGFLTGISGFLTTTAMKTTSAFVPAIVLLAGGIWLATRFHTIAGLEERNDRMASRLAAEVPKTETSRQPAMTATALDRKPVDWAEVARQLKDSSRHFGLNPHARLEEKFIAMSLDEASAALDEISAARLTEDARELLEKRVCDELSQKGSPKLVLNRFVDSMKRGSWKSTLGGYFKTWMDQNPDEAIAWLAKHVDGMKNLSFGFLDVSFHPLLASSPETAGKLLDAIPPGRRLESLRSLENRGMSEAKQTGWAEVVRRHLPAKDRLSAITWPTMNWSDGDGSPMTLPEVSGYMERIKATQPEREACILTAAQEHAGVGNKSSAWLEDFRKWVAGHAPELVEKSTGVALAGGSGISRETVDLALGYHAKGRNDAILLPLLERDHTDAQVPLARELAEHLTDDTLRKKYLAKFNRTNP